MLEKFSQMIHHNLLDYNHTVSIKQAKLISQIIHMQNKNICNKPTLAPFSEYNNILSSGWENGILTHNGPLVQRLEKEINDFLGVDNTVAVTNGTIALQIAIKALSLKGEIITSPFSWIASIAAIQWEGCKPVYVDADIDTFNIDVSKIEDAITENTCAIMPVHVFSNPCDVKKIDDIAQKYNLKVIYDSAHAFGVTYNGTSIFNYGDISRVFMLQKYLIAVKVELVFQKKIKFSKKE